MTINYTIHKRYNAETKSFENVTVDVADKSIIRKISLYGEIKAGKYFEELGITINSITA